MNKKNQTSSAFNKWINEIMLRFNILAVLTIACGQKEDEQEDDDHKEAAIVELHVYFVK